MGALLPLFPPHKSSGWLAFPWLPSMDWCYPGAEATCHISASSTVRLSCPQWAAKQVRLQGDLTSHLFTCAAAISH